MTYPEDPFDPREADPIASSDTASVSARVRAWGRALVRPRHIPGARPLERALRTLSPAERAFLYVCTAILAVSAFTLAALANYESTVSIPQRGGSLTEGLVGAPRFINPLLAVSDVDQSLATLVYSGLMRATPEGEYIPDLAERYEVSEDGTAYTFTIRSDAVFHDGTPVTADDVVFTVERAQRADINSPRRADWEGVTATAIDDRTVRFVLERPYAPFLENTTLGVLPAHLWEDVAPGDFPFHELNTHPIGSGPYAIERIRTDASGAAERYTLRAFEDFALGEPHLSTITFVLYPNTDALIDGFSNGVVESIAGVEAATIATLPTDESRVVRTTLPRVFAVFFNQNQNPVFTEAAVREALDVSLDKSAIVEEVLGGYGAVLDSPIPPGVLSTASSTPPESDAASESGGSDAPDQTRAEVILEDDGWERDSETGVWENGDTALSFTLTTADTPQLAATAEMAAETWRALGADVTVETYPASDLNISSIRPREYEALLFGEIVGRTLDLFAFWHSSQRNDPGLNLALYANSTADDILSDAREETDRAEREALYREFADIVRDDIPAIFLYAPEFVYVIPDDLAGVRLGSLARPAERFLTVHEWHTEVERVWEIFAP